LFGGPSLVPQLEALAERMQDKIRIVKIDTDDYAECATRYLPTQAPSHSPRAPPPVAHSLHVLPASPDATTIGVRGLPSLYFIQDGKLKHKMEGAETADNLAKLVDHFFFDGPAPEAPQVPTV
jgi:thioredoxin-like negative regulator of GroEL